MSITNHISFELGRASAFIKETLYALDTSVRAGVRVGKALDECPSSHEREILLKKELIKIYREDSYKKIYAIAADNSISISDSIDETRFLLEILNSRMGVIRGHITRMKLDM